MLIIGLITFFLSELIVFPAMIKFSPLNLFCDHNRNEHIHAIVFPERMAPSIMIMSLSLCLEPSAHQYNSLRCLAENGLN